MQRGRKNTIIDYITSMNICVTPEEEIKMIYGGNSWLNIYLSDGRIIHMEFFGKIFFHDLEEDGGTLYYGSTENYNQLLEYLFDSYPPSFRIKN